MSKSTREESMWQKVIADMQNREAVGYGRYGRYLTAESREVGLQEAYEEALDQCVYLRKALEEKEEEKEKEKIAVETAKQLLAQIQAAIGVSESSKLDDMLASMFINAAWLVRALSREEACRGC